MKVLHTSDWHIGKRLLGRERIGEQREVLREIAALCERERVELVLVAGDVFDTYLPSSEAEDLFYTSVRELAGKDRAVVIISGNHDSAERLDFASSLLAEQNVHIAGRFTGCPKQVVLNDRHGPIEFTLLPFVRAATVRHYLPDADITDYDSAVGAALAGCEPAAR